MNAACNYCRLALTLVGFADLEIRISSQNVMWGGNSPPSGPFFPLPLLHTPQFATSPPRSIHRKIVRLGKAKRYRPTFAVLRNVFGMHKVHDFAHRQPYLVKRLHVGNDTKTTCKSLIYSFMTSYIYRSLAILVV